jgi:hypothetical protein
MRLCTSRVNTSEMLTPLQVTIRVRDGTRHEGIKVEFVGSIGGHTHVSSCSVVSQHLIVIWLQNCSMIAGTITNSCRYRKNWLHLGSYIRFRRSISSSRMSKSSSRVTRASMSSCGASSIGDVDVS